MKKKNLRAVITLLLILIMALLLLTGCGNNQNESNENNVQNTQEVEVITLEEAQSMVTQWANSYYTNALVEAIEVDVTENTVNNEALNNYYTFAITVGTDYYTVLVNKNTSKVYLFNEDDTNNLVELTKDNFTQYIKITKYTGNGYTLDVKEGNNCHLTMDMRAAAGEGNYEDSDGTFAIENNNIKVTLSNGKEYEFTISNDSTITLVEQEENSTSGITVGTYKGEGTDGQYSIEIKSNNGCHFQYIDPSMTIDSDGTYTISGNTITFKLNSGNTINCIIQDGNKIYWDENYMTFSK